MPRRATLGSSRDFRRVYRAGTRARRDGVTVWALRCDPPAPTRVGLAVRARGMTAVGRIRRRSRLRDRRGRRSRGRWKNLPRDAEGRGRGPCRGRGGPRVSAPARLLAVLVAVYRRWVSPLLGRRCRYEPTCSAYALAALHTHGAWRGGWLALRRIARCHPFAPGGVDHVPGRAS